MKKNLLIAVLMTVATTVLFGLIYPLVVTGLAGALFPALRRANALSAESLMQSNMQQSIAEPAD